MMYDIFTFKSHSTFSSIAITFKSSTSLSEMISKTPYAFNHAASISTWANKEEN